MAKSNKDTRGAAYKKVKAQLEAAQKTNLTLKKEVRQLTDDNFPLRIDMQILTRGIDEAVEQIRNYTEQEALETLTAALNDIR